MNGEQRPLRFIWGRGVVPRLPRRPSQKDWNIENAACAFEDLIRSGDIIDRTRQALGTPDIFTVAISGAKFVDGVLQTKAGSRAIMRRRVDPQQPGTTFIIIGLFTTADHGARGDRTFDTYTGTLNLLEEAYRARIAAP
ncbi:hypothetical protein pdul_cds_760 [Pandoravirus dulcis]|uniref:Uncharacterized protein n=1 Tax=Pandoravirus dulcis TaxID=1349409 RepID=S4VU61_9VIRU|nr:hypothetical protein pdul_cds_760 [Pandoravirus dulcis]AGO82945.1 hypothetical protein pdul_cds_760 [Pandoravirus dulcis]